MARSTGNYTAGDFKLGQKYFVKFKSPAINVGVIHATYKGVVDYTLKFRDADFDANYYIEPDNILQVADG